MATITRGKTFISGETVEPADMHQLVDSATVTGIVNADIASNAAIDLSKLNLGSGITSSQIADGAVTGAAGGGKIAASAITAQTQLADPLASGDEFLVHDTSASALRRVAFNAMQPAGSVLQTVQATNATYTTITSTIAPNDTAPTSSDGTEILSQAITPTSSANKVLVRFAGWGGANGGQHSVVVCRGATVIQTVRNTINNGDREALFCEILDSPATTSSTTYSVRIGSTSGQSFYLNGTSGGRELGGTSKATLTLQEIKG